MSNLVNPPPASNLKFDASNNVLSNINAQNINPNIGNPYGLPLLSHQTGLSFTSTTANLVGNIGTSITIPRNGKMSASIFGHVNGGTGRIDFTINRGGTILYVGSGAASGTIGGVSNSGLFGDGATEGIATTTSVMLLPLSITNSGISPNTYDVLDGDVIQFRISNATAGDISYIDDLVVMLQ